MSTTTITRNRRKAFVRQACTCYYCGLPMWLTRPVKFAQRHGLPLELVALAKCTAEHLHAKSQGGTNEASNIVAACAHCNHRRHEFREPMDAPRYREFVQMRMSEGTW